MRGSIDECFYPKIFSIDFEIKSMHRQIQNQAKATIETTNRTGVYTLGLEVLPVSIGVQRVRGVARNS